MHLVLQVCLEQMTPPTKIFQCVNGHHVCETCKSMKFYLPPNIILVDEPMEVNDHNANILFYRFRLVRPMCPSVEKGWVEEPWTWKTFSRQVMVLYFQIHILVILWYPHFSQFLVTLIIFQDIVTTDQASDAR